MAALTVALAVFVLVGSGGCKSFPLRGDKKTDKTLLAAVDSFNNSLRWGNYHGAARWLDPSLRDEFWAFTEKLQERTRLTDFELRPDEVNDTADTVRVVVRFRCYSPDDPRVQTKTLHQIWHYQEDLKLWVLVGPDLIQLLR
jgi:hypothetical protein